MEKYLFNDGTNGVKEVQSKEELLTLIQNVPDRSRIRIWIFNTSEWVSYDEFTRQPLKTIPSSIKEKKGNVVQPAVTNTKPVKQQPKKWSLLLRIGIGLLVGASIFLVYNFTRLKWVKQSDYIFTAPRPANNPPVNFDSLLLQIEGTRGQKLDKVTRTNLRIRNNWPDMLQLQMTANWEKSGSSNRFSNTELVIDNSTGYNMDDIEVRLTEWKDQQPVQTDTLHFRNVGYASPARRSIEGIYNGDSLSVSFHSIKSKAFNFCYSADKKSNYGNFNDRWFCKD